MAGGPVWPAVIPAKFKSPVGNFPGGTIALYAADSGGTFSPDAIDFSTIPPTPIPHTGPLWMGYEWLMLCYLSEVWQMTMGRLLQQEVTPYDIPSGLTVKDMNANDVQFVDLQVNGVKAEYQTVPGTPTRYELGWIAFMNFGVTGKLQPICFDGGTFFPESQGMTGVKIFLKPGLTAQLNMSWRPFAQTNVETQNDAPVMIMGNTVDGLGDANTNVSETVNTLTTRVVLSGIAGGYNFAPLTELNDSCFEVPGGASDFYVRHFALMYLFEAWELICGQQAFDNDEPGSLAAGTSIIRGSVGLFIRTAYLRCTIVDTSPDQQWGNTGFYQLGWISFGYDGLYTPPQPINDLQSYFQAEFWGADEMVVHLKPGVTCNYDLFTVNNHAQGGTINGQFCSMVAGDPPITTI